MISKLRQEEIKEMISKQKGQDYPCSNQIVTRAIVLRNRSRIEAFEQAFPQFVCYRKSANEMRYINSQTEELYRIIFANDNSRGYRYYKAIIDSTIDEEIFNVIVSPQLAHYCCEVEFF